MPHNKTSSTTLRIEPLDPLKLPLITRLYKAHYPSAKAKSHELTLVAYQDNHLCGVVRLRPIDRFRLVTGMLVVPEFRGQGIAHHLMEHCQQHLFKTDDYCFAYEHLVPFYAQHSFTALDPATLPEPLHSLFQRYSRSGKALVAMHWKNANPQANSSPNLES